MDDVLIPWVNRAPRRRSKRTWLSKTFNSPHLAGFASALEHELARLGRFDLLGRAELGALRQLHGISEAAADQVAARLVAEAASGLTLADFTAGARSDVSALAALLQRGRGDALGDLDTRATQIFEQEVRTAAIDEKIAPDEAADLTRKAEALGLADDIVVSAYSAVVLEVVNNRIATLLADDMLSPEEDAELADFLVNLNVRTTLGEDVIAMLNEARRAWAVSFGPLPVVPSPVLLQRNEVAHAHARATALEERTRTTRVGYAGPALRVKIMPGVYYRAGIANVARQTEAYQHSLGVGDLVVTNKRLIFAGDTRSMSPRLDSIIGIDPYRDGVGVQRATGKPITYMFDEPDPWFGAILQRARAEA